MIDIACAPGSASSTKGTDHVAPTGRTGAATQPCVAVEADEELLLRVLWGEEAALAAIYDRYNYLVYAIALRIVGDCQSAEEVVQDVFQAVWQSAATFQPGGVFLAWLIGIARHRAIDATRSRRYRSRAREDALDDARISCDGSAVESQTDAILIRQIVRVALAELPAPQRQVLELAYYGGLTYQEIAARTGEPVGTVKSRVRLGLSRLRELLRAVEE